MSSSSCCESHFQFTFTSNSLHCKYFTLSGKQSGWNVVLFVREHCLIRWWNLSRLYRTNKAQNVTAAAATARRPGRLLSANYRGYWSPLLQLYNARRLLTILTLLRNVCFRTQRCCNKITDSANELTWTRRTVRFRHILRQQRECETYGTTEPLKIWSETILASTFEMQMETRWKTRSSLKGG